MQRRITTSVALAVAALQSAPVAHAQPVCRYEVAGIIQGPELPFWGHPATIATGLNNHGEVVGYYSYVGDARAFYWSQETGFVALPPIPGAYDSQATDINDHGVIVGYARGDNWGMTGWVFENGHYTYLSPLPGGAWIEARAINNHGQVVGYRSIGDPNTPGMDGSPYTAYIWQDGKFNDIGLLTYGPNSRLEDINEAGLAVGWTGGCATCSTATAVMCDGDGCLELGTLPGASQSAAFSLNEQSHVVGRAGFPRGTQASAPHGFAWIDGVMSEIPIPAGFDLIHVHDVGSSGLVAGVARVLGPGGFDRGFIWNPSGAVEIDSALTKTSIEVTEGVEFNSVGGLIVILKSIVCNPCSGLLLPYHTPGDIDGDCKTAANDLNLLLSHWGEVNIQVDLDGDPLVGLGDLGILLTNWTR